MRASFAFILRATGAALLLGLSVPASARAQEAPPAPAPTPPLPGPPVRRIATAQAISTVPLGIISNVRALSDGRVLLNDGASRRLLLLDSTLQQVTVVLDSISEVENAYGVRNGTLLRHRGDSSLFVDPATLALLVLDEAGRIARVRAVPRAQSLNFLLTSPSLIYGEPAVDPLGRLVHRMAAMMAPPAVAPPPGMPYIPSPADSAFIVGIHLDTRRIDTLGVIRTPRVVYSARLEPDGYYSFNSVPNPLPVIDDWAVLADGSVAFVRGIDYRVEVREPDGTMRTTEKLVYPWVRLADDDKERFADSMRAAQVKSAQTNYATQMIAWSNLLNKPYPASFEVPAGYVPPPGLPKDWILPKGVQFPADYVPACPPGVTPPNGGAGMFPGMPAAPTGPPQPGQPNCTQTYFTEMYGSGYTPPAPIYRAPTLVRASDLPDYKPPFAGGAARADADGNLWIRTTPPTARDGLVFDVVNGRGALVDRIQLPPGYTLAGFGPGRVVFLGNRDATGLHLSRVRLSAPETTSAP
jgi:hypothetical protein